MPDTTSILDSVKKAIGIEPSATDFDPDIIMHINSVFFTLQQLGVGPEEGFMIEDKAATWGLFFGDSNKFNAVKSYMYLRVRMLFDPPATSFALNAIEKQITELEWRLNVQAENAKQTISIGPVVDNFGEVKQYVVGEILIDPVSGDVWKEG